MTPMRDRNEFSNNLWLDSLKITRLWGTVGGHV